MVITKILWSVTAVFLIFCGLKFSLKYHFRQLDIKEMIKSLKTRSNSLITPIESLTMSLSSRIGVGSIAGIAIAIKLGGVGSIFWIWVITLITSILTYLESIYGSLYQVKSKKLYYGGPHYYLSKGLKLKKMAKLYALLIVLSYGIGFLSIQSNTINTAISLMYPNNELLMGIIITLLSGYFIFSNTKNKTTISKYLVPLMSGLYLILGIYVIIKDPKRTVDTIFLIIKEGLNFKALTSGLITTIIVGIQRGIFATEAGMGTSAIASGMTRNDPTRQGFLQVFGIYFTSFVICTITAIIILTSNYTLFINNSINGIETAHLAFNFHFGLFGEYFLLFFIILFAFSTIISGYYFGENSFKYLFKGKKKLVIFRLIVIMAILISSVIKATAIWNFIDILVAFICLINIYAIYKLETQKEK